MMGEGFLLRTPLLGKDSRFAGYLMAATGTGNTAPYRQLFAAIGADKSPGGLCVIEDTGAPFDELTEEIPQGVTVSLPPSRASRIGILKQHHVGTCVRVHSGLTDFPADLSAAEYVWLGLRVNESVKSVAKLSQRLPGKRIVGGVSTRDQFDDGREIGAHLFEGDWYRRITTAPQKSVTPGQASVLELINLARTEAPPAQIEQVLKRDATLSFRLLRYINSAGFGLSCEIQSFRHAVSILGYQNLGRWLALLLATSGHTSAAPVLMREAAARGRLTELVGESFIAAEERDNLFIVGVFSMLPSILQMPMDQLVGQLNLSESVNDALTARSGLYGPILKLAESVEVPESGALEQAAGNMQLSAAQVNRLHLEALAWANKLAA
ncbi:MAG: HDOD domain-containing protein [Betaproteobacteria bacterium]|nr:HDOD domain-containing protein [Betaproteobacteria bacterium]